MSGFFVEELLILIPCQSDAQRSTDKRLQEAAVSALPALQTSEINNDEARLESAAVEAKSVESAAALAAAESVHRKLSLIHISEPTRPY